MTPKEAPAIRLPAGVRRALAAALREAEEGAVFELPPGEHDGPFFVRSSVTVRGASPATTVLRGGEGFVVGVVTPGVRLTLEGVALVGGASARGGALSLDVPAEVALRNCVLTGCRAGTGGGAIYAGAGFLTLASVLIHKNGAPIGGGLLLDGDARAELTDVVIEDNDAREGGGLFVREGVRLAMRGVFVRRNGASRGASALTALASTSRAPEIRMAGGALAGGRPAVQLSGPASAPAPTLAARDAMLPQELSAQRGFRDEGGCRLV